MLLAGCSEKELDPNDPVKSFAIVKEPYDDENYEHAITRLGEFKSRFPYSRYASEAELLIANSQFELEQFSEAALSYEQFVKLHPKHPKTEFAMFRIGECYWEESSDNIDQEQEYTIKAIDSWKDLVVKVPQSSYAEKARKLIQKGQRRIADSIAFVVKFYCKQEIYHACAFRALQLADEYKVFPDLHRMAVKKAIESLEEVAKVKAKDPTSDKNLFLKNMSEQEIRARADQLRRLQTQDENGKS
jgi:outer membrane protein assembly factor BamD